MHGFRTMVPTSGLAFAVLIALTQPLPQPLGHGEIWYVHYEYGLRALDAGHWDEAIQQLQAAIQQKPSPNRNARTYGMRFVRYFPHYFLGLAYYSSGQTERAVESLERARAAGEILKVGEYRNRLEVLLAAASGPRADAAALADAEAKQREAVGQRLRQGLERLAAGDTAAALVDLEAVLALDPENAEARRRRDEITQAALAAELAQVTISRPPAAPLPAVPAGEPVAVQPSRPATAAVSEAAVIESKGWELLGRGRDLLDRGSYEAALTKFRLVEALVSDLDPVPKSLADQARSLAATADAELRRSAEAQRQAELAKSAATPKTPPRIIVNTPVSFDDPLQSELVQLHGVALDDRGIAEVTVEVNGHATGPVQARAATRGLGLVVAHKSGSGSGAHGNQGTAVNFYQNLRLENDVNDVVIRARSVDGRVGSARYRVKLDVKRPQIWAAVIGIGDYSNPTVPDLHFTLPDAESFRDYLTNELGVPADHVFMLIDSQATTPRLKTVLGTELRKRAGRDDLVLIYYAGHGAPEVDASNPDGDGLEKYLLTYEADPNDLYGTAFSMNEVATIFGRLQAERVIFIADACYSGASGGRTVFSSRRATITDAFLDRITRSGKGRVILSASSANEPSQEDATLGHGVFTYYLLEGLNGAADRDRDGLITVDEAYDYVARAVPEATGQSQHPVKKGEVEGDLVLGYVRRH